MLDDDFIEEYRDGMLVDHYDGIRRRMLPRIFIYSTDYPEKYINMLFRQMSHYLLQRCLEY